MSHSDQKDHLMTPDSHVIDAGLAAVEVRGVTRSAFLLRSTLAAGAVLGAGSVGPFVGRALAQGGGSGAADVDVLNFALTLEYLETAFYDRALKLPLSAEVRGLARTFGEHEREHVEAIRDTIDQLGGDPVRPPELSFPRMRERAFLRLAQTLEETGVSAYNGAAVRIESPEVLAAAGTIVQVEARHAAGIRVQRRLDPAPRAADETLDMEQVLAAIDPFVKS
jgi:rubrerythrin